MEQKSNYTIVGIFVICLFFGIAITMVWMSKYSKNKEYEYYKINTQESVSGLNEKSPVKLHGIVIGDVDKLLINKDNAEQVVIVIKVTAGSPIKEDTTAVIETQGITGLRFINLAGGTQNSKRLETSEENIGVIPSIPSVFARVDKGFSNLMDNLDEAMIGIKSLITPENTENVKSILININEITTSIAKTTKELEKREGDLENIFSKALKFEDSAIDAANSFANMSNELRETIKSIDKAISQSFVPLKKSFEDFGILINQIQQTIDSLEKSPSDLIFKSRKYENGPGE